MIFTSVLLSTNDSQINLNFYFNYKKCSKIENIKPAADDFSGVSSGGHFWRNLSDMYHI